jgi:hypothetical protein
MIGQRLPQVPEIGEHRAEDFGLNVSAPPERET